MAPTATQHHARPFSQRKLDIGYFGFFLVHVPIVLCKFMVLFGSSDLLFLLPSTLFSLGEGAGGRDGIGVCTRSFVVDICWEETRNEAARVCGCGIICHATVKSGLD